MVMSLAQLVFMFAHSFVANVVVRIFVGMSDAMVFVALMRLFAL